MLNSIVIHVRLQFQHKLKHELHAKLSRKVVGNLIVFYVTFGSKHFLIMILETLRISKRWKVFCFGCFMIKKTQREIHFEPYSWGHWIFYFEESYEQRCKINMWRRRNYAWEVQRNRSWKVQSCKIKRSRRSL